MYGNVCGSNNLQTSQKPKTNARDFTNKKYLYWPDPTDTGVQICLEKVRISIQT